MSKVLAALLALGRRDLGALILMADLCRHLQQSPDDIEPLLRELEKEGLVLCSPGTGPVAVVILVRMPEPELLA